MCDDAEAVFSDCDYEKLAPGPYLYWGYEDEPDSEELYDDDADEGMLLQEPFCYADAVARSDDDGWFYED